MTYPIRAVPDGDTAWGTDLRNVIAGVNDHQTRVTTVEVTYLVHAVGNSGTALTLDASTPGSIKTVTMTGNCTFTLTGAVAGVASALELVLTQDGTGGRTATWPASVKWAGGAPVLSTAIGAVDRIVLVSYNGGTTWFGDVIGKAYA
jgi:hypothetical protein